MYLLYCLPNEQCTPDVICAKRKIALQVRAGGPRVAMKRGGPTAK